jgi:regulator of sigma E protease
VEALTTVVWFLVALGILITVHEAGHFLVAKHLGVKVLRFSIGFGRPLWARRFGPDHIEYVVAALPLGGYVKMLDEREGPVAPAERGRAFNRQALWVRFAVVAAGPAANFLFAVLAYWLMFGVGVTGLRPVLGPVEPASPAAAAGLKAGDEVIAVGGSPVLTWDRVLQGVIGAAIEGEPIVLEVRGVGGAQREVELDLGGAGLDELARGSVFDRLGVQPARPDMAPVVGQVEPRGAAARAGLLPGDRLLRADGQALSDWRTWVEYVRSHGGRAIALQVERAGEVVTLEVRPDVVQGDQGPVGRIGAAVQVDEEAVAGFYTTERYGPFAALGRAAAKTWEVSALTLRMIGKMVTLQVSVENLSGPISIAQYAGHSAKGGLSRFLEFLGVVSVSLAILNLLPIPLLDGGHLMYYLVELLKGRPVSEDVQLVGQRVGLAILIGLMGLAFFNDLARVLG